MTMIRGGESSLTAMRIIAMTENTTEHSGDGRLNKTAENPENPENPKSGSNFPPNPEVAS